jgi:predicted RNA-binding Zn ribbon-like protein
MNLIQHRWVLRDIVGGDLTLDAINTVSGWKNELEDWIPDITSFLTWARTCGLLDAREHNEAARQAKRSPVAAERVLASMKELRLALWSLVDSLEHHKPTAPSDLKVIDEWARRLADAQQMTVRENHIELRFNPGVSALEFPSLRVTAAALWFLKNFPARRIKTCPAHDCGWKFVDRSKNRSRRWCDMAVCGNLTKTRRYRARNR